MGVLSKTLKNYKNTYTNRLAKYLDDYEDNSELLFLQKELNSYGEALETLNTYKADSKTFGFKTLKDHFDISILKNLGYDLDKVDNHISSINMIMEFIYKKKANFQNCVSQRSHTKSESFSIEKDHFQIEKIKISERWHALAYLLELKAQGLKPPINLEGDFIKTELEAIGKVRTGLKGQGFYKAVKKHYKDLDDPTILKNSFGKDWKGKIIELFNDNDLLKDYLNNHY